MLRGPLKEAATVLFRHARRCMGTAALITVSTDGTMEATNISNPPETMVLHPNVTSTLYGCPHIQIKKPFAPHQVMRHSEIPPHAESSGTNEHWGWPDAEEIAEQLIKFARVKAEESGTPLVVALPPELAAKFKVPRTEYDTFKQEAVRICGQHEIKVTVGTTEHRPSFRN